MAKRKIADFSIVVYNNDGNIEVAFNKAKKVPKAYDNFVATLEIACLGSVHKVISMVKNDGEKTESKN